LASGPLGIARLHSRDGSDDVSSIPLLYSYRRIQLPGTGKSVLSSPAINPLFDPERFLANIGEGRRVLHFLPKHAIFVQGMASDAIFYIHTGRVKLTVLAKTGKEATIGILNSGDFFGEGGIAGQPHRMSSATAVSDCSVMRIESKTMRDVLHREHSLSDLFVAYLLSRNLRYEEDLVDQLFNSSEKRLARTLLVLSQFGKEGRKAHAIADMSQTTLAEMVGTTRSRVSFFMNRFRDLGFIHYDSGSIEVHDSLLNMVLHD
jgi:CRP/FNR family transcriptional regulator, cyclic AMP receptor protein